MEPEDLLRDLDLEEPSAPVDADILSFARCLPPALRRQGGRRFGPLAVLASVAMLVPVLLLIGPQRLFPPGLDEAGNVAEAAPLEALEELRSDLDQIREMAELIPPDERIEQETIDTRVRAILSDLEKLEDKLQGMLDSTSLHDNHGKRKGVHS